MIQSKLSRPEWWSQLKTNKICNILAWNFGEGSGWVEKKELREDLKLQYHLQLHMRMFTQPNMDDRRINISVLLRARQQRVDWEQIQWHLKNWVVGTEKWNRQYRGERCAEWRKDRANYARERSCCEYIPKGAAKQIYCHTKLHIRWWHYSIINKWCAMGAWGSQTCNQP